jgi:glycosyltransferase involved in cell wall biosynthesis
VVLDNASTDDSRAVLASFADRDPRLRIHLNATNIGPIPNWNLGLELARGEYVRFLFSDDRFASPDALGKLVGVLDRNPAVVLATSAVRIVDEHGGRLYVRDPFGRSFVGSGFDAALRCLTRGGNLIGEPSAVIFRRAAAPRGFHLGYEHVVDLELWLHLLEQGGFAYLAEPLCDFRDHPYRPSVTHIADGVARSDYVKLLRDYLPRSWVQERLTRQRRFAILYNHRKRHGRDPRPDGLEAELMDALGRPWYAACWLRHRLERLATGVLPKRMRRAIRTR